jgi:tetratricopeptide (TPR) repeat protein
MAYVRSGQVDEGLEDFKQAIQLNLNDVTAYNGLGEAYTKKGEYQLALQAYSSAILRKPNDFFAYYARGNVYLIQLKDYAASITDYSKAIELRPNHVDAHFNRAVAYERLGDTAKARQDYVFAAEHGDSEATQVIERMDTTGFPIIIPRFRLR